MNYYAPIKIPYTSPSEVTNKLFKRKRILESFGGRVEEWLQLAEDFLADDCRLNHAYCMHEFRKLGGEVAPVEFHYEPPEPPEPEAPPDDQLPTAE